MDESTQNNQPENNQPQSTEETTSTQKPRRPEVNVSSEDQIGILEEWKLLEEQRKASESASEVAPVSTEFVPEFETIDQVTQWQRNILRPAEEAWENSEDIQRAFLMANDNNPEEAKNAFLEKHFELQSLVKAEDQKEVEGAQVRAAIGLYWGDNIPDVDFVDDQTTVSTVFQTLGGARQYGTWWTDQTRSPREYETDKGKGYINDQNEWVELKDNEVFLDHFFEGTTFDPGEDSDLDIGIMNSSDPRHRSADGRAIVNWEYVNEDPKNRMMPGLKAVYEGDLEQGEIVSRFDLTDALWLKSNYLKKNALAKSVGRTAVNVGLDLTSGFLTLAHIYGKLVNDESLDKQKQLQLLKSFKVSTSDKDQQNFWTANNILDMTLNMAAQIGIAGGSGRIMSGLSRIATAGMGAAARNSLTQVTTRVAMAATYGPMQGYIVRDEALKAGYSEASANALFTLYAGAVGLIGTSNSIFGNNLTRRIGEKALRENVKVSFANLSQKAVDGVAKGQPSKHVWNWVTNLRDKTNRVVGRTLIGKAGKGIGRAGKAVVATGKKAGQKLKDIGAFNAFQIKYGSKTAAYLISGAEESAEEVAEQLAEYSLKGVWSVMPEAWRGELVNGQAPKFKTIDTVEFWDSVPDELLMSAVAGFGGGMMGHMMLNSSNIEELLPFKGQDEEWMYKLAHKIQQGGPEGKKAEDFFIQYMQKLRDSGALGSKILSIKVDDKGNFVPVIDSNAKPTLDKANRENISHADANYALALYQLNLAKSQIGKFHDSFEQLKLNNPTIRKVLNNHETLLDLAKRNIEAKRDIYDLMSPAEQEATNKALAANPKKEEPTKVEVSEKNKDKEEDKEEEQTEKSPEEIREEITAKPTTDPEKIAEYEKKLNTENKKRASALAEVSTLDIDRASELIFLEDEFDDFLNGKMSEVLYLESKMEPNFWEDLKENYPDLAQYGKRWVFNMLQADETTLKAELEDYESRREFNEQVAEEVSQAKTPAEILEILKGFKIDDEQLVLRDLGAIKVNANNVAFQSVTQEELDSLKQSIIDDHELFNIPNELNEAADKLTDLYVKEYEERPATEDIEETTNRFVDTHLDTIIKINNSARVMKVKTIQQLEGLKLDTKGDRAAANLKNSMTGDVLPEDFKIFLLNPVSSGSLETKDSIKVFDKSNPVFAEYFKDLWELRDFLDSDQVKEDTTPKPGTDLVDMFIRDFDTSDPAKLKTTHLPLFKVNTQLIENPDVAELVGDSARGTGQSAYDNLMLEKTVVTHRRVDSEGNEVQAEEYVFTNSKGAKELLYKLRARKAILDSFIGKSHGETLLNIKSLSDLRQANAAVFNQIEFGKSVNESQWTVYSNFFSYYILDPVEYMRLAKLKTKSKKGVDYQKLKAMNNRIEALFWTREYINEAMRSVEDLLHTADTETMAAQKFTEYRAGIRRSLNGAVSLINTIEREDIPRLKIFGEAYKADRDAVFEGAEPNSSMDALVEGYKALNRLLKGLYQEDDSVKHDLLTNPKYSNNNYELFLAAMAVDYNIFLKYYSKLIPNLEHRPNVEQEIAMYIAFATMVSTDTRDAKGKLKYGMLSGRSEELGRIDMIYVNGDQGTGKTTMLVLAERMAQQYREDYYKKSGHKKYPQKALAIGMEKEQARKLYTEAKQQKVAMKSEAGSQGLPAREFFKLIIKGEKDIKDLYNYLGDVGSIMIDEATHIQGGADSFSDTDLGRISKVIAKVNDKRMASGLLPVKVMLLGDRNQGGWRENMPDLSTPKNEGIDYSNLGKPNNVGEAPHLGSMLRTPNLTMTFRYSVAEIPKAARKFLDAYKSGKQFLGGEMGRGAPPSVIETEHGQVIGSESKSRGGVQTVSNSDEIFNDPDFTKHIQDQIDDAKKHNREFKVAIVNDVFYKDPSAWSRGSLFELASQDAYKDHFDVHSILSIQGAEYNYVLVNLPPKFLPKLSDLKSSATSYNYKLVSMLIGRAKEYVMLQVPTGVNIVSKLNEDGMNMMTQSTSAELEKDWSDIHNKLHDIETQTEVEPKEDEETVEEDEETEETDEDDDKKETKDPEEVDLKPSGKDITVIDPGTWVTTEAKLLEEFKKKAEILRIKKLTKAKTITQLYERLKENGSPEANALAELILHTLNVHQSDGANALAETLIGESTEEDDNIVADQEPDWDANKQARALDLHGYAIGYSQVKKQNGQELTPAESLVYKWYYARDIFGSNNVVNFDEIHEETQKALDPTTNSEYKFSLLTYEFGNENSNNNNKIDVGHAIVATNKDGQRFIISMFPAKAAQDMPGSNLAAFLKTREDALEPIQEDFANKLNAAKTTEQKIQVSDSYSYEPASGENFNAKVKAGLQALKGTTKMDTDYEYHVSRKAPTAEGNNYNLGFLYLEVDITDSFKYEENNPIAGKTIGAISRGNLAIAKFMKRLGQSPYLKKIDKYLSLFRTKTKPTVIQDRYNKRLAGLSSITVLDSESLGELRKHLYSENSLYTYQLPNGDNVVIVILKGKSEEPIPIMIHNDQAEVIFGIDKNGEPIINPKESKEAVVDYRNSSINEIKQKADRWEVVGLEGVPPIEQDRLGDLLAEYLDYDPDEIRNASTKFLQYKLASRYLEYNASHLIEDIQISLHEFKQLIQAQYNEMFTSKGKQKTGATKPANGVKFSRMLSFSSGPHAGRAFILYTARPDIKLDTEDDVRQQIGKLDKLRKLEVTDASGEAVLENINTRDGVGVILLDYPKVTLTQVSDLLKNTTNKSDFTLNQAMVSINSTSKKHLLSSIIQIANHIKANIIAGEFGVDWVIEEDTNNIKGLIELTDSLKERTLHDETLKVLVKELVTSARNGDEGAINLIQVISQVTQDGNLGTLVAVQKDDDVNEMLVDPLLGPTDSFAIHRSGGGAITYMAKSVFGEAGELDPHTEVSLSSLIRLLNGTTATSPIFENQQKEVIGNQSVKWLAEIVEASAEEGTIEEGFFMSPGYSTRSEWASDWAFIDSSEGLDNLVFTKAKGIDEPSVIYNIEKLAAAVDFAYGQEESNKKKKTEKSEALEKLITDTKEAILAAKTQARVDALLTDFNKKAETLKKGTNNQPFGIKVENAFRTISEAAIVKKSKLSPSKLDPVEIVTSIRGGKDIVSSKLTSIGTSETEEVEKYIAKIAYLGSTKEALSTHIKDLTAYLDEISNDENRLEIEEFKNSVVKSLSSLSSEDFAKNTSLKDLVTSYDNYGRSVAGVDLSPAEISEFKENVNKAMFSYDVNSEYSSKSNVLLASYLGTETEREQFQGPWVDKWVNRASLIQLMRDTNWGTEFDLKISKFEDQDPEFLESDTFKSAMILYKRNSTDGVAGEEELMADVQSYVKDVLASGESDSDKQFTLEVLARMVSMSNLTEGTKLQVTSYINQNTPGYEQKTLLDLLTKKEKFDPRSPLARKVVEFENSVDGEVLAQLEVVKEKLRSGETDIKEFSKLILKYNNSIGVKPSALDHELINALKKTC